MHVLLPGIGRLSTLVQCHLLVRDHIAAIVSLLATQVMLTITTRMLTPSTFDHIAATVSLLRTQLMRAPSAR